MIQANELRIDNVFYFAGGVATISGIFDLTQVWVAFEKKELKINLKKLNPIPLTPEILESAGFEKHETNTLFRKHNFYLHRYVFGGINMDGNEYCFKYNDYKSTSILYLHQLQNLYFALTGQELTLNLHATV